MLAAAVGLGTLLMLVVGVSWALSSRFMVPAPYRLRPEFRVIDARDGRVTLPPPAPDANVFGDTRRRGVYGLLWGGGNGRLGEVLVDAPDGVVRALETDDGAMPAAGEPARLDAFVFRRDPLRDRGIPFEDVEIVSDAGQLAGWWVQRPSDAAVLLLHGRRRGERAETLRALPVAAEGRSALVLAYRNHRDAAASPDGLYHYGHTEVRDALAAVAFLGVRGVRRVAIVGLSMGGQIALRAAAAWPTGGPRPRLTGVVLDSPLIDPAATISRAFRSVAPRVLAPAAPLALAAAAWRAGLRWRELDQRRYADRLRVPLLLYAGVDDDTVPIDVVDDFARRVRAPLEYVRLDGVGHVEGWNRDPAGYEAALRTFLARVLPP